MEQLKTDIVIGSECPSVTRQLVGNDVLFLNQPATLWQIQSGALAVFSSQWQQQSPTGERRYLFTVTPGELLLGAEPIDFGLIAVALEPTEIVALTWADLMIAKPIAEAWSMEPLLAEPLSAAKPLPAAALARWINHFSELPDFPQAYAEPQTEQYVSLNPGEIYKPAFESEPAVCWVTLKHNEAQWLGQSRWPLNPDSAPFPLGKTGWLLALGETELGIQSLDQIPDPTLLAASMAQFHRYSLELIQQLADKAAMVGFYRFQARQQLNQQVTQTALQSLASLLKPDADRYLEAETPLLVAAGAVGRVLGVRIDPAAKSEAGQRMKEPLEAIARASQLRLRRVLLRGQWWTQDVGPLVAYLRENRHPVALLPVANSSHYELLDGMAAPLPLRVPVDAAMASRLEPVAFMFYRPLPEGKLQAWNLLQFALYGRGRDLWMILLTGIGVSLLGMVVPQATAVLVDDAIPYGSPQLLVQIGLALLAVAFGRVSFQFAQAIAAMRIETGSDAMLQAAVWDRLLKLRTGFFREYSTGDLQSRVSSVTAIRRKLSGTALDAILSGVFAFLNLGLLFYYSPKLAGLAVFVALLVMTVTVVSGAILLKKKRPLLELEGELYGLMVQLINGVSKLRMAGAESRAFAQWGEKYRQQLSLVLSTQQLEDGVTVFNTVMPTITSILLFWVASSLVTSGTGFSTGTFLAFSAAFAIFISGATNLSSTLIEVLEVVPLWMRSQPILQAEPEVNAQKADPGRLTGHLCLDRATFRYREDGPLILNEVTITAKPGEFIALVGPSGSGKSTVLRLLLGFEQPQSGTVYFDGQDLSGLDVMAVRRQLGVVLQNGRINAGSLFENISGGALITLDDAWRAAEMAGFAEDVRSFPMEMHTVISEGGGNLSGGQRQRLVIARALALNPKILLLDEATSALDNRTQAIVSASLDRLKVTRIVVAHRLSTIRNADRIYVIQAGQVVQQGTFDELAQQTGIFAQLIQRQVA